MRTSNLEPPAHSDANKTSRIERLLFAFDVIDSPDHTEFDAGAARVLMGAQPGLCLPTLDHVDKIDRADASDGSTPGNDAGELTLFVIPMGSIEDVGTPCEPLRGRVPAQPQPERNPPDRGTCLPHIQRWVWRQGGSCEEL